MRETVIKQSVFWTITIGALLFMSPVVFAQTNDANIIGTPASALWVDVAQVLDNIAREVPILTRFVVALSYTTGVCLITLALIKLKQLGHNTVMMSTHANTVIPMVYIITGTMMLYFPTILNVGSMTVLAQPAEMLSYKSYASGNASYDQILNTVVIIIQFVGYVAFLRGWYILMKIGSNNQPGTFGKGLVHLLGGILAANITTTWAIIMQTFGFWL